MSFNLEDTYLAKYDEDWFKCKIVSIDETNQTGVVSWLEYAGETSTVPLSEVRWYFEITLNETDDVELLQHRTLLEKIAGKTATFLKLDEEKNPPVLCIAGKKSDVLEAEKDVKEILDTYSTEVMVVPQEKMGLIVGAKGQQRQNIQNETGVLLDVPPRDSPVQEITLIGNEQSLQQAKSKIEGLLGRSEGRGAGTGTRRSKPGWTSRTIEVPPEKIPLIIGTQGATVSRLQDECDVRIDISRKTNDLTIFGSSDSIDKAEALIKDIIAGVPRKSNAEAPRREPPTSRAHESKPLEKEESSNFWGKEEKEEAPTGEQWPNLLGTEAPAVAASSGHEPFSYASIVKGNSAGRAAPNRWGVAYNAAPSAPAKTAAQKPPSAAPSKPAKSQEPQSEVAQVAQAAPVAAPAPSGKKGKKGKKIDGKELLCFAVGNPIRPA